MTQDKNREAKDFFGRLLMVGDFVVPLNSSTFNVYSQKPLVVTRIGSADKVQLNASSYAKCEYLLCVNDQFAVQFGDLQSKELRAEFANDFNFEKVKVKPASTRYQIVAHNGKMAVVSIAGTSTEKAMTVYKFIEDSNLGKYPQWYTIEKLNTYRMVGSAVNCKFVAVWRMGESFSLKAIKELCLNDWIDTGWHDIPDNFMNTIFNRRDVR